MGYRVSLEETIGGGGIDVLTAQLPMRHGQGSSIARHSIMSAVTNEDDQ